MEVIAFTPFVTCNLFEFTKLYLAGSQIIAIFASKRQKIWRKVSHQRTPSCRVPTKMLEQYSDKLKDSTENKEMVSAAKQKLKEKSLKL